MTTDDSGSLADRTPPPDAGELAVYEVFAQTSERGTVEWQASLLAGSPAMALMLARENFLRRREIFDLWVVPRDAIARAKGADDFFRLPKTYREVSDYQYLVGKWRQYHQQAMTPDTMA